MASKNKYIDIDQFERLKEMMGKKDFRTILQLFKDNSKKYVDEIKRAKKSDILENAIRPAHTLKSSAAQIGAFKLSTISRNIEELIRESKSVSKKKLDDLVEELDDIYKKVEEYIEDYFKKK